MSKEFDTLLSAIIRASIKVCIVMLLVLGFIISLFIFRVERYVLDWSGSFRRNCKALNNQELSAALISKVPGHIEDQSMGYVLTKDFQDEHIKMFKEYMIEMKKCENFQADGSFCDDYYNYFGIFRTGVTSDWQCNITVDENTYIMKSEAYYQY